MTPTEGGSVGDHGAVPEPDLRVGDRVEYAGPDLGTAELPRGYGWLRRGTLGTVVNIGGAGEIWVGWDTGGEFRMEPDELRPTGEQQSS